MYFNISFCNLFLLIVIEEQKTNHARIEVDRNNLDQVKNRYEEINTKNMQQTYKMVELLKSKHALKLNLKDNTSNRTTWISLLSKEKQFAYVKMLEQKKNKVELTDAMIKVMYEDLQNILEEYFPEVLKWVMNNSKQSKEIIPCKNTSCSNNNIQATFLPKINLCKDLISENMSKIDDINDIFKALKFNGTIKYNDSDDKVEKKTINQEDNSNKVEKEEVA